MLFRSRETWRRFRRHRLAIASAIVLGIMILGVIVGPWIWKIPINEIDFTARLVGPSLKHPFGTDDLGQDIFARMLYGGRISLAVGLAAMVVAIAFVGDGFAVNSPEIVVLGALVGAALLMTPWPGEVSMRVGAGAPTAGTSASGRSAASAFSRASVAARSWSTALRSFSYSTFKIGRAHV